MGEQVSGHTTALSGTKVIVANVPRLPSELLSMLARHAPASILDVANKRGSMSARIAQMVPGADVCGPAVTCRGVDLLVRRAAIDLCEPGDVLVIAAGGDTSRACFGSYTARHMASRDIAGVVIDGATRDIAELRRQGFPTFAAGVSPLNFEYPSGRSAGAINVPVSCGNAIVRPGDIVVGDADGVVCVPYESVADVVARLDSHVTAEGAKWEARYGELYGAVEQLVADGFEVKDA